MIISLNVTVEDRGYGQEDMVLILHQHNKQNQKHLLCTTHDAEITAYTFYILKITKWFFNYSNLSLKIGKLKLDNLHNDPKVSYKPRIQTQ